MLTDSTLERILDRIPSLTLGVIGDLFLDRYLDLDATLTEPSLETGLDAYQVVRVRPSPGAAGTVINNLVALGVGRVCPVAVLGDDGEGYELRQALRRLGTVADDWLYGDPTRRTPTYTKPMLCEPARTPRELNRLDIKNRTPLPAAVEERILTAIEEVWRTADALVVLDQVSEADCGVVSRRVRERLAELGERDPPKLALADSRERIGLFRSLALKPNRREVHATVGGENVVAAVQTLADRAGRPVFCTQGEEGIRLAFPQRPAEGCVVPAYPVTGPTDPVGAGDSTSAGIVSAAAAGVTLTEAAAFGNLIASITVQQLGTTGTATPAQVRERWRQVQRGA